MGRSVAEALLTADTAFHRLISNMVDMLEAAEEELGRVEKEFRDVVEAVEDLNALQRAESVLLDIGGHRFHAAQSTLQRGAPSMLAVAASRLFAAEEEEDGSLFLDRDPTHFALVLQYLRAGPLGCPFHLSPDCGALQRELRFFHLLPAVALLEALPPFAFDGLDNAVLADRVYRHAGQRGGVAIGQSSSGWQSGVHKLAIRLQTPVMLLTLHLSTRRIFNTIGQRLSAILTCHCPVSVDCADASWTFRGTQQPLGPPFSAAAGTVLALAVDFAAGELQVAVNGVVRVWAAVDPASLPRPLYPTFWGLVRGEAIEVLEDT